MTVLQAINNYLNWAAAQVGYKEGPNNWNKYAEGMDAAFGWHVQNQPWCDIFVKRGLCDCFGGNAAAAMIYETYGHFSAGCAVSADYFKKAGAWFNSPQPGDQIFFYDKAGKINHTGIVESVSGGVVHTIEGNCSDGVRRNAYATGSSTIAGFGRPKWSVVADSDDNTPAPAPTPEPVPVHDRKTFSLDFHYLKRGDGMGDLAWLHDEVQAAQFLLNGRGASVGKYGADGEFGPGTEAAVLAYQRRNGLDVDGEIGPQTLGSLFGLK